MEIRPGLELANLTDVGCERENNEDYFCYTEPQNEEDFRRKGRLAVIADGMGGQEGGEIASRLAVEAVRDAYLAHTDGDPHAALISGFRAAHEAIRDWVRHYPHLQGMGTTCTAVVIAQGQAHFAHIGDSRLYLIRGMSISLLTRDHTVVDRLIEQGVIAPEDAATHPQRHVLTAALGANREASADFSPEPIPLQPGDVLVLCTDGLWGQITAAELVSAVRSMAPQHACKHLANLAKERGGPDNLTIQILQLGHAASANGSR